MLLPLSDEGPFLLLLAEPAQWHGSDESSWVIPVGEGQSAEGWAIMFPGVGDGDEDPDGDADNEIDVSVELLDRAPNEPSTDLHDVVDVSVNGTALLVGSGAEVEVTDSSTGAHHVRLSSESIDGPVPRLRIQSWPADQVEPLRVVRARASVDDQSADDEGSTSALPHAADGLAAAARIGNDVDQGPGHRQLSGMLGVATARAVVQGSPEYHSDFFRQVFVWTRNADGSVAAYGMSPWDPQDPSGDWSICVMDAPDQVDRITGWSGAIWSQPHPDNRPPDVVELWWRWVQRDPPSLDDVSLGEMRGPVLPLDTVRVARFAPADEPDGSTEITIEHRDVPVEWVDDLSAWWAFQLALHANRE